MLVLSRKKNESVYLTITTDALYTLALLGKPLKLRVEVVEIDHSKVRLGFAAPKAVQIMRAELLSEDEQRMEEDQRKTA